MKTNLLSSIRWKLILVFFTSIILAVCSVGVLIAIAYAAAKNFGLFHMFFRELYYYIGVLPVAIIAGVFLFIVFVFLLSRGTLLYLEEISRGLHEISKGNLDIEIPQQSSDELSELAGNINHMARQLKQLLEEERNAERIKNELITSVSHDLRTPLTSVLGYLELIVKDLYRDEVELRYYVDIAYDKAQRLTKLIDGLFEYTKVSYGGLKLHPDKIDLGQLLEQMAEEFVPALKNENMDYRLKVPAEKIMVMADGDMLARVFDNLIANAIRYGKSGKCIEIELETEDTEVIVKIGNYGEPIPHSDLPYIFDRFYRVEKSRSSQTGGSGLGLAIAKNIVELHNGKISAYSYQDLTVFEVRLGITT